MKLEERPILIIIGNNKNGGIAKHAAMLANGFAQRGIKSAIVVTKEGSTDSFFDLNESVSVVHTSSSLEHNKKSKRERWINDWEIKILKLICDVLPQNSGFRKKISYTISKKRKTLSLRCAIKAYKNPIVIALGLDYAIDIYFATKYIKCSLIYGTRTSAEQEMGNYDRVFVRDLLDHFECVVSQTKYTADFFAKLGIRNIEVIGNPLDIAVKPFKGQRSKTIVNFCRLSKEKNLELLIRAFSKFHLACPDYKISIYGNVVTNEEYNHKKELLALIDSLDLCDYVDVYSARKDIHNTVINAGMFVSTSNYEGLSNSMIEAMAIGLPCICTDCDGGGAREFIKPGVNGLLVPKNDEVALVEAMKTFADDEKFSNTCGENATQIRELLDQDAITCRWEEVIVNYCN